MRSQTSALLGLFTAERETEKEETEKKNNTDTSDSRCDGGEQTLKGTEGKW